MKWVLGLMKHTPPIPVRMSKDAIHSFAENVARLLDFLPGDAIEPLLSKLGGHIRYCDPIMSDKEIPESIIVDSQDRFVIFLPTMTSVERDRFTIAHELGHFFLHYPMVQQVNKGAAMGATRWVDQLDEDQQRAEWEANWFAAAFLMPADRFRNEFANTRDLARVAKIFRVSKQAAEIRAKTLGLH